MAGTDGLVVNKRRRIASPPSNLHITDLPDIILADVGAYLPKTSRALFAVAMTAPPSSWRKKSDQSQQQPSSATSKAILSTLGPEELEVLDFVDIEKSLAMKLTDDTIHAILVCIDAVNNLKILKLTGCVNIIGSGLESLRGSLSLKQIDLSVMKKHDIPFLKTEPLISEAEVLPILDSIVDADRNSLRHLHLPPRWREERSAGLIRFRRKYNSLMSNRSFVCSKCDDSLEGPFMMTGGYGLHNHTCYNCMNHFCGCGEIGNDTDEHGTDGNWNALKWCCRCENDYCVDCITMKKCSKCDEEMCTDCSSMKECQDCGETFCHKCGPDGQCACWEGGDVCSSCVPFLNRCQNGHCNKGDCSRCIDGIDGNEVDYCDVCGKHSCSDCRYLDCRKDLGQACSGCLGLSATTIIPKLQEENEKEKEQLREENRKLRHQVEELRGE